MQEPIPRGALLDRYEIRDDEGRPIGLIYGAGDLGLGKFHITFSYLPLFQYFLPIFPRNQPPSSSH